MVVNTRAPPAKARIALIEDDMLIRLGQEILLRDWGYDVLAIASYNDFIAIPQEDLSDLVAILADFNLGEMETGADLALRIVAAVGRPIPTAVLSASFGRASQAVAIRHGFAFFSKPVDPAELHSWIDRSILTRF